jgi:hypothetical protein
VDSGISQHSAPDHLRSPPRWPVESATLVSVPPLPHAQGRPVPPPAARPFRHGKESPLPNAKGRRFSPWEALGPFAVLFVVWRLRAACGTNLARASDRAIACQARTHPHSKRCHQWRRHIVQRQAAVPANLHGRAFHAQPVSSSGAFRIQTLHGTAGQMLHRVSVKFGWGTGRSRTARILRAASLCVKRKPTQLVGARFPATQTGIQAAGPVAALARILL